MRQVATVLLGPVEVGLQHRTHPGPVLAQVAQAFADARVSIETVRQAVRVNSRTGQARANLVIVTHQATEAALASTDDWE